MRSGSRRLTDMLKYSPTQGDKRYLVVGYVGADDKHPESIGWTDDREMAEAILQAITQRWPRYGGGVIKDFKQGAGI